MEAYRSLYDIITAMGKEFKMGALMEAHHYFDTSKHVVINNNGDDLIWCGFKRTSERSEENPSYYSFNAYTYWIIGNKFIRCDGNHGYEYEFKGGYTHITYDDEGWTSVHELPSRLNVEVDDTIKNIALHLSLSDEDSAIRETKCFKFGNTSFIINYDLGRFRININRT